MTERCYLEAFPDGNDLRRDALDRAHDIRKFEIELYWRRAAYFWVFIGSLFAAFGAIFPFDYPGGDKALSGSRLLAIYLILGAGFYASLAWYFVNRGSKFWQENWEAHVDALEDGVEGPLYKTTLSAGPFRSLLSGYPFSVSRINILLSIGVTLSWVLIAALLTNSFNLRMFRGGGGIAAVVLFCATTSGLIGLWVKSKLPNSSSQPSSRKFGVRHTQSSLR